MVSPLSQSKELDTSVPSIYGGVPSSSAVKHPPAIQEMQETQVRSLGQEDPLEKEMATHSSILVWKIPWTEEPRGLQSIGSQKSQTRLKRLSMHVLVDLHDIIKARKQAPGSHLDIILASAMYIL